MNYAPCTRMVYYNTITPRVTHFSTNRQAVHDSGDRWSGLLLRLAGVPADRLGNVAVLLRSRAIVLLQGIEALDDAAILWIGSTLFVELCPDDVVKEHQQALESNLADTTDEIVDVDATDVNENR